MRDRLLAGILDRLQRYKETRDPRVVLSAEADFEAIALIGPHTGFDFEAFQAVGELRWLRYRERKDRDRGRDLMLALQMFVPVLNARREHSNIPTPLRLILESGDGR